MIVHVALSPSCQEQSNLIVDIVSACHVHLYIDVAVLATIKFNCLCMAGAVCVTWTETSVCCSQNCNIPLDCYTSYMFNMIN
jgi:hypothetical protein